VAVQEIRRQQRDMQVTVWAPTPAARDAVARLIDPALSVPEFLTLADGTAMRIIYQRSQLNDGNEQVVLYRRDFVYRVEFALCLTAAPASILQSVANVPVVADTPPLPLNALLLMSGSYLRLLNDGKLYLEQQ